MGNANDAIGAFLSGFGTGDPNAYTRGQAIQQEMRMREALLPGQLEELNLSNAARSMQNKVTRQNLANQNDLEAAFGLGRGGLTARATALDFQAQQLSNQSAALANRPLSEKLDEIFAGIGRLIGQTGEQVDDFQRTQTAMQNAQTAQQGQRVNAFMQQFDAIEQQASQMAGKPIELFGNKDSLLAAKQVDDLIAQGLDEETAFNKILGVGLNLAQQKFMQMTKEPPAMGSLGQRLGIVPSGFPSMPPPPRGILESLRGAQGGFTAPEDMTAGQRAGQPATPPMARLFGGQ